MNKKKIYCFNNGGSEGWWNALAIAEDGTCLAGHVCSHEYYMKHDLGITSDWKHEHYDAYYGKDNWELEWVPTEEIEKHQGLQKAFKLNEGKVINEDAFPSVKITYTEG